MHKYHSHTAANNNNANTVCCLAGIMFTIITNRNFKLMMGRDEKSGLITVITIHIRGT